MIVLDRRPIITNFFERWRESVRSQPFRLKLCGSSFSDALLLDFPMAVTIHSFSKRRRVDHGQLIGFLQENLIMCVISPMYSIGEGLGKCWTNVQLWKKTSFFDQRMNPTSDKWRLVRMRARSDKRGRWELWVTAGPVWKECRVSRLICWYLKAHPGLTWANFRRRTVDGHYNWHAHHINLDSRCNWVGNIKLMHRLRHMDEYKSKWRSHIGVRKRPAAKR